MSQLLFVSSSLSGAGSKSGQIAREFIDAWQAAHPGTRLVARDLGASPVPHLTGERLGAVTTPDDRRSDHQRATAAEIDTLIEEIEAADTIVVAAPMYNFTISSTLKAWIDHITRAGRTFRYTPEGPQGQLKNKRVFVVTGRGGFYSGDSPLKSYDFQEPYLRTIFGFLGLDDVTFIHVEGQQIGPDAAAQGLSLARNAIGQHVPAAQAA
ncbi:MAG: FMN-dependent NADH-azoreductase [Rhizomicrobium sp.]